MKRRRIRKEALEKFDYPNYKAIYIVYVPQVPPVYCVLCHGILTMHLYTMLLIAVVLRSGLEMNCHLIPFFPLQFLHRTAVDHRNDQIPRAA